MWYKLDIHIHTPASSCYIDYVMPEARITTRPEHIVDSAIEHGLDAIAITDHNTVEWVDRIRQCTQGTSLCVFPGIEVSAAEGHLLAFFDASHDVDLIQDLLERIGFDDESRGKGYAETKMPMLDVIKEIAISGGVVIAAHIDRRPRGLITSELSHQEKVEIINSPYLSAAEITIPQTKELWNSGWAPGFSRQIACVQGSDAHAPEEISRRPFYADLKRINIAELSYCFKKFPGRIRFPHEME